MSFEFVYHVSDIISQTWNWCAGQDGRIGFAVGFIVAVIIGRILSIATNPAQKVLSLVGMMVLAVMIAGFLAAASDSLRPGQIPLSKAVETPNAHTLQEIQQ